MSWCRTVLLGLVALTVAGCGFQPLYKKNASDPGVSVELEQIKILTVKTKETEYARLGQEMRNLLLQRLNPDGAPAAPRYLLENDISVSLARTGIQITDEATRARLTVRVRFVLMDAKSKRVLYRGDERSVNSYNVADSQYATLSAEQDAARRAVREISDSIRIRLAIYFERLRAG